MRFNDNDSYSFLVDYYLVFEKNNKYAIQRFFLIHFFPYFLKFTKIRTKPEA